MEAARDHNRGDGLTAAKRRAITNQRKVVLPDMASDVKAQYTKYVWARLELA